MPDIAIARDFRADKATIVPLTSAGVDWVLANMEAEPLHGSVRVVGVRVSIEAVSEIETLMQGGGLTVEVQ